MNKKIIALAIAAAVAAPMAAQAAPTVYGKINMGISSFDDGNSAAGTNNDGLAIFDEASRLGFKGSEDLGGGLSLVYKMEGTVDMDGSAAFNFNRDKMLGLKGGFGTVAIGRMNTAYKMTTGKMDLFADMAGDITSGDFGGFDQRENNMVKYMNKFGAVSLAVDLHLAEAIDNVGTTKVDESAMGNTIGVNFKAGPVNVAIGSATCGGACANGADEGSTSTKIGVQWKSGPHTVNGQMISDSYVQAVGSPDYEIDVIVLQYGIKMGKNTFQVSLSTSEGNSNVSGDTSKYDTEQTSIGVVHAMSKNTKAWVVYSSVDNDADANSEGRLFSGISNTTTANGKDPSSLTVGITHKF